MSRTVFSGRFLVQFQICGRIIFYVLHDSIWQRIILACYYIIVKTILSILDHHGGVFLYDRHGHDEPVPLLCCQESGMER